jgi:hypothetical protein
MERRMPVKSGNPSLDRFSMSREIRFEFPGRRFFFEPEDPAVLKKEKRE